MKKLKNTARALLQAVYFKLFRFCAGRLILPRSRDFGFREGTPLGRYYIEAFLRKHADRVRGRCLEFGEARYKPLFPDVGEYVVLSAFNGPEVTLVGDIHNPPQEWEATFDSIVCTQVFEHLEHPEKAAAAIHQLLRPDGVLLLTVPFFNMVHGSPSDYFRYTEDGICGILERAGFIIEARESKGNFVVSLAALMGFTTDVFDERDLNRSDKHYPYTITVLACKGGEGE